MAQLLRPAAALAFVGLCATSPLALMGAQARPAPGLRPGLVAFFEAQHHLSLDDVLWGDLHVHTQYSGDAALNPADVTRPEDAYAFARGVRGFSFMAVADHAEAPVSSSLPEGETDVWQSTLRMTEEALDEDFDDGDGGFITFPGYEYTNPMPGQQTAGRAPGYGHKNVLFRASASAPPARFASARAPWYTEAEIPDASIAPSAADLWEKLDPWRPPCEGCAAEAMTLLHTPANIQSTDWDFIDGDFVRAVEIFSQWGNSEGPPPEGAGCRPDRLAVDTPMGMFNATDKTVRTQLYRHFVLEGDTRYALGFTGGADDHTAMAATPPYLSGQVGILSADRSRDGLWDALWARHTLAAVSSAVALPVLFSVETAGRPLLSGDLGAHDGQAHLRALANERAQELQILVDGCLVETVRGAEADLTLPLTPGNHFIYLRALRRDASPPDAEGPVTMQTWASPVYLVGPAGG